MMAALTGSPVSLDFWRQYAPANRDGTKWPLRWTLMTASQSASSMLKLMRSRRMPALFTRMSRPPSSPMACSIRRWPPSQLVMSS